MMFSCNECGKIIIKDDKGKVLVGCPHYKVEYSSKEDYISEFDKLFPGLNLKK